jgi:hypothetical protein
LYHAGEASRHDARYRQEPFMSNESDANPGATAAWVGSEVVLDLKSQYVCVGTLIGEDHRYFILKNADVHDLRDSSTTREVYVLDCRRHGLNWNRKRVLVRRDEVVSLSLLADVRE